VAAMTARIDLGPFGFQAQRFLHGAIWQPLTCTFIQTASFFFLFNVMFLYWSGVEVEKYLGRSGFLKLLGLMLLVPTVLLCLWSFAGVPWNYYGSYEISIGMFIAFATLYPNVEMFGWITLKWLAFAGIVLASMQYLPAHDWGYLSVLWGMCLTSFVYVRFLQGRLTLPENFSRFNFFRRKPAFSVLPHPSSRRVVEPDDLHDSIDPVLDKISKSGIGSLTPSERRALDRARARLLKKSQ